MERTLSDGEFYPECWGNLYSEVDCTACTKRCSCKTQMSDKELPKLADVLPSKGGTKDPFNSTDGRARYSIRVPKSVHVKVCMEFSDGTTYEGSYPIRVDSLHIRQERLVGKYPSGFRPQLGSEELAYLPVVLIVEGLMVPGGEIQVTGTALHPPKDADSMEMPGGVKVRLLGQVGHEEG